VPAQGDEGAVVIGRLEGPVRRECGPNAELSYEESEFRPYLYRRLVVIGPDGTPYDLHLVPATTAAEDIAAAIIQQNPGAMTDTRGRRVRTTVDHIRSDGTDPHRLEPRETLHDAGVRDEDQLQVGTEAIAGAVSPVLHTDAVYRAKRQINRFVAGNRDIGFTVVRAEPPDVPLRYLVEFDVPGFAPPADYDGDPLEPLQIGRHQVHIALSRFFPVEAPLVYWESPVFHPNIWQTAQGGGIPGRACLGQLMDGWRPNMSFSLLCRLIVDIACYRNYDVVEADAFPDPRAAKWARTPEAQARSGPL
jgi:hypothetical protein